jgi:hypothetical protein
VNTHMYCALYGEHSPELRAVRSAL